MRSRTVASVVLLWLLVPVPAASAQVRCLSSFPVPGSRLDGPPGSVLLWMTEPVALELSQFRVSDLFGRRFDLPPRASADGMRVEVPLRDLPDGVYVVQYQAASVLNGHVTAGLYSFGVRRPVAEEPAGPWPAGLKALGALVTVAAAASGSVVAAVVATVTAFAEWAQAARSVVPAAWPVLLRGGWAGLLLAGTQAGWASLLAAATTAVWALPARPPYGLVRLVAAGWLAFAALVVAAGGGPLSLLASSHGPALVLMVGAYGVAGVLATVALPVLGVRPAEPPWARLVLASLLAAAWALRTSRDVAQFSTAWLALSAVCAAAYLWGRSRGLRRDRR